MNRRSFVSFLAGLPFVGRVFQEQHAMPILSPGESLRKMRWDDKAVRDICHSLFMSAELVHLLDGPSYFSVRFFRFGSVVFATNSLHGFFECREFFAVAGTRSCPIEPLSRKDVRESDCFCHVRNMPWGKILDSALMQAKAGKPLPYVLYDCHSALLPYSFFDPVTDKEGFVEDGANPVDG